MPVSFHYQFQNTRVRNKKKFIDWILLAAYLEQKEIEDVSYVFCSDEYLLDLNKKFLKHKSLTDIITFDYSSEEKVSAEIYISIERVRDNARSLLIPFETELRRVMIHGVLHCMGYTDKTPGSKTIMRKKEEAYLHLFLEMG